LAKIPKLSSYFGVRASSSQSSASNTVASSVDPVAEDLAKQDECVEVRESEDPDSSAERELAEEDALAEPSAPTLGEFCSDLGLWGDIDADTREFWIKKGPKDCQHSESKFEKSARRYPGESFQRRCTKTFHSMEKNPADNGCATRLRLGGCSALHTSCLAAVLFKRPSSFLVVLTSGEQAKPE
jgi:hypothetical protein